MGLRIISRCFLFVIVSCFRVDTADGIEQFDPLEQITKTLPGSIQVDEKRMVIEFCLEFPGFSGDPFEAAYERLRTAPD